MTRPEGSKLTFGSPTAALGNSASDPQEEVAFVGLGRCELRTEGHGRRRSGHRISPMAWTIELPGASSRVVGSDYADFV